jgi:DNA-binding protein H-NS
MAQTLQQIRKQIAALQQLAQERRRIEVKAVIQRTRETIQAWELTPEELFDGPVASASPRATRKTGRRVPVTKYADGKGGAWAGRGKRPQWLRDALAGGAQLSDFLVQPGSLAPKAAAPRGGTKRSAARSGGTVTTPRFSDGNGNVWTGRGPRPKWLKDAMASGKSLEEFARNG